MADTLAAELVAMTDAELAAYVAMCTTAEDLALVEEALAEAEALRAAAAESEHQARADEALGERYARWWVDPAAFAAEAFRWPEGQGLAPYQSKAMRTLARSHRLVLRKPHGVGGTATVAMLVLWFALTRDHRGTDWKTPTTASVWRQLDKYLWPEIHKWAGRLRWDVVGREPFAKGRELLDLQLNLTHGSAFAVASNDPAKIEGAHAEQLFYVFDEAKAIPTDTFDAAEGAFSSAGPDTGSEAYALANSTPGEPAGRFYDLCRRAAGTEDWTAQHVTLAEGLAAGRISAEWAEARARQWGIDSPVYANRVLGEFAVDSSDAVIPLSWVEAANERWATMARPARWDEVGFDVASTGSDRSVLVGLAGDYVGRPVDLPPGEPAAVASACLPHVGLTHDGPMVVIDVLGVGAGVYYLLQAQRELPHRSFAFDASDSTDWRDISGELRFANLRAAAWWHLRELLDPSLGATLGLPPDDRMTGDLTAPHWRAQRNGAIVIESKDDIRSRIGRSTDVGDAVVMGAWARIARAYANLRPSTRPAANGHSSLTGDLLDVAL